MCLPSFAGGRRVQEEAAGGEEEARRDAGEGLRQGTAR